jgi:hypothetical protein
MVEIDKKLSDSMQNLNKSADWQKIRDNFIIPMMKELNCIYDDALDLKLPEGDFKAEYLAKQKAYGKLETIIRKIDYYAPQSDRGHLIESFE